MIRFFMFLWLSVIDKKVAHPNEIQNTFVCTCERRYDEGKFYEGTLVDYLQEEKGFCSRCYGYPGSVTTSMSGPRVTRKRSLRPTHHVLGDGLRKLFRLKLLRISVLAAVFLAARWNPVLKIPVIPTLVIMFVLRHLVLTPLPEKAKEIA